MRPEKSYPDTPEMERVEALLRTAADFEPEESVPADLAQRALERRQNHRTVLLPGIGLLRPALLAGFTAACLCGFLLLRARDHHRRQTLPFPIAHTGQIRPLQPDRSAPSPMLSVRKSRPPQAVMAYLPSKPSPARDTRPIRERSPRSHLAEHRQTHVRSIHSNLRNTPPRIPKVRWQVQTVQREAASRITPVLLARPDAERNAIILMPVALQTPLSREDTGPSTGDVNNNSPSSEENFKE